MPLTKMEKTESTIVMEMKERISALLRELKELDAWQFPD